MIVSGNGAEKTRLSERRDDGKAALPVKAGNSALLRLPADFAAALPPAPSASDGEQDKDKCVSGGRGHSGLRHSPQNPHEYGFYTSGSYLAGGRVNLNRAQDKADLFFLFCQENSDDCKNKDDRCRPDKQPFQ